jgi:hypothetical protein
MVASKAEDAVLVDFVTLSAADRPGVAAKGWDPYEVWRTRVLLPRLAGKTASNNIASRNSESPRER